MKWIFADIPTSSLLIIGLGIGLASAPFGYYLVEWLRNHVRRRALPTHLDLENELFADPVAIARERDHLSDLLDAAKREVEAQGHVIAAREKERDELKQTGYIRKAQVESLEKRRADLEQQLTDSQGETDSERNEKWRREGENTRLRPPADWAETLIESARNRHPQMLQRPRASLAWDTTESLKKPEPVFDDLEFEYRDVHRLIIGEDVTGFLARWNGDKFNHETILRIGVEEALPPYDRVGWAFVRLRLRQRVSRESADSILAAMRQYVGSSGEGGINFDASDLHISVRVLAAPTNEELFKGQLTLGGELTARYTLQE